MEERHAFNRQAMLMKVKFLLNHVNKKKGMGKIFGNSVGYGRRRSHGFRVRLQHTVILSGSQLTPLTLLAKFLLRKIFFYETYYFSFYFRASIRVPIIDDNEYEKNEYFFIELGEPVIVEREGAL